MKTALLSKYVAAVLAMLTMAVTAGTVKADDSAPQVWADYHEFFYLNPDWEFYGDGGARYQWDYPKWSSIYLRPSLRLHSLYKKPSELRGGIGVFYSFNEDASNTLEIRPWLGILIKRPRIGPLTISNYVRLEERLIYTVDERSWSHSNRLRYRIATKIPLSSSSRERYTFIPCSFEAFFDVGPQVEEVASDRMRFDVGVGHIFRYVWTAEFHLVFQVNRGTDDESFGRDHLIFRFQLKRLWSAHDYMSQQ